MRRRSRGLKTILRCILGFICSFSFSLTVTQLASQSQWLSKCDRPSQLVRYQNLSLETNAKSLVLVSVMTHFGTINTRAVAIYKTWAQDIPGKVIFFLGHTGNKTKVDIPCVVLPVDDVYPPQEKAMMMLKYVYEHYGDSFRWFIRADDDVYINRDNLVSLLTSIAVNDDVLLGHPGIGTNEEKGKLGLEEESNFCIGGTGIVMSRSVLKKVYPHLDHCIKNTATAHEDSEVGRCIKKFVGLQCPWGYEASEIFYQDYGDDNQAYHADLDLIPFEKIVSLHPVKDPAYLFRIHHHFLSIKQRQGQNSVRKIRKHIKNLEKILTLLKSNSSEFQFIEPNAHYCKYKECGELHNAEDGIHSNDLPRKTWAMFRDLQSFGVQQFSTPVETIRSSKAKILKLVTERAKQGIILEEKPKLYHGYYFGKFTVGYIRESPIRGNLYEVHYTVRMKHIIDGKLKSFREPRRVKFKNSYGGLISRMHQEQPPNELINIVLPCNGTVNLFENFLKNINEMLGKFRQVLRVFVVFFRQVTQSQGKRFKSIFEMYRKKFGDFKFIWSEAEGEFNQETALKTVLKHFSNNQLLLFTQTYFMIDADFLERCRQNTEKGRLYFPLPLKTREKKNAYKSGQWESDDYSTFCAYSDDVQPPVNASLESVSETSSLVDVFIAREQRMVEIFRVPDPGLLMLDSSCLTKDNRKCMERFDSTNSLFDYILEKDYLKDFL